MHFLPAGGKISERRNVEIAEKRHGDGPRNGRGGHHQVMRIGTGKFQHRPLPDAELVLLVDHDQPQPGEGNVLLDYGLRTHDEIELAGRGELQNGLALRRRSCRR